MYSVTRVSLVWWNTSLSPPSKFGSNEDHRNYVGEVVKYLIFNVQADFISLGEVNDVDIETLGLLVKEYGYDVYNGYRKSEGRAFFDLCVLYRKDIIFLEEHKLISVAQGNRKYKLAQRLKFYIYGEDQPLHAFISHWPSRIRMAKNDPIRSYLGVRLRDEVTSLLDEYQEDSLIVLLGDYNDEPFDTSISEHLLSTRDRELVKKNFKMLYNPFWQFFGGGYLNVHGEINLSNPGTYYYKSDPISRWKIFDQMIFSSSFLKGRWRLNENSISIVDVPNLRDYVTDAAAIFDHFPIASVIERVNI